MSGFAESCCRSLRGEGVSPSRLRLEPLLLLPLARRARGRDALATWNPPNPARATSALLVPHLVQRVVDDHVDVVAKGQPLGNGRAVAEQGEVVVAVELDLLLL